MTKDCSWNYHENYKLRTWAFSVHGNSTNNLLSYCGLIDAKIRATDKDLPDLPVQVKTIAICNLHQKGSFKA
jgi:hypothetical protein